ncbi:T9SS type A sorting domain-containing protein [Chryseobacterium sp. PBS4-4]|uniref:T9SS type A sorting domain-containing protein n=1 Tax=Chryseobacterium edaphi TaxID=2976532 RepID=A0ABT2W8D6_9FLAO|nr:T9SS type A sorting domain-containing protein [Chryseobacterium edaphi]MCU7618233.1 T9SS type A sorting domain-containing protein [Chryseobacterium edaphi]
MNTNLLKRLAVFVTTLCMSVIMNAQQAYTPIRGIGIEATALKNGLVCLGCYSGDLTPVVDANLNNSVNMGNLVSAIGGNGISVRNRNTSYPAGYITGFNVDLGTSPITATLLSSIVISTYKNGILQESSTSSTLVSVPAFGGSKSRIFFHFKSTKEFDEVRLYQNTGISIFSALNVYYAFAFDPTKVPVENNNICDDLIGGTGFDTNVSSSSNFIAPLSYLYEGQKITDGDKNSAGVVTMPAGLLGSYTVGVLDKNVTYPAGNRAGFVIAPESQNTLISVDVLKNISIETYLYGQLQDSQSYNNGAGFLNIAVLSLGGGKQKLYVNTTKPFNEVRLKINQPLGVNLGAVLVYYAFEEPASCDCKKYLQTNNDSPYKGNLVTMSSSWTGIQSSFLSSLQNAANVVDSNSSNFATFNVTPFSIGARANLTVANDGSVFPIGTYGGFVIDKGGTLFDLGILSSITVSFYNGTMLTESKTGGSLANGRIITSNSDKIYIGMTSTKPFNRMKITINNGLSVSFLQTYRIYNAFVEGDIDRDGVPDCYDQCPNGDDTKDEDGDGIPDACDIQNCNGGDKSTVLDSDNDGIVDSCDLDSDNDGIPDALEEDANKDGLYENDDLDGDILFTSVLGDGIANYLDLDSDNDGILDLFESGIPNSVIDQIDTDHNGVIDVGVAVGTNGIADVLETFPDSGIYKYPVRNKDGDAFADYIDLSSDGNENQLDLYAIGKGDLDQLGGGFITPIIDIDRDGIMDQVDTDTTKKGSPNSPLSPYATFAKNGGTTATAKIADVAKVAKDITVYPNPVKAGENLYIKSAESREEGTYTIFSAQGQLVKSGKFTGNAEVNTSSLTAGLYIIKVDTKATIKAYKIIVK